MQRLARIREPKQAVRGGQQRIQFERLLILLDGLIVSARGKEEESQSLVHDSVRIQANRAPELGIALLITSCHAQTKTEPIMAGRVTRVEFD